MCFFYRAMLYAERGYATVCRVSVRPSLTFRYRDHIGSNTRLNSLRLLLGLTPTWAIWCNRNNPKLGWNRGGALRSTKKPAISPKRCKIGVDQGYNDGLIGSRIRAFDWYQNQWPWMTINGESRDCPEFLQRVNIACYVNRCISYRKSVRLTVCHTLVWLVSCQNDLSYDHAVFTGG